MAYRISKIARIVGISSEALRFYEKKGILEPVKDERTGYRTFGPLDIGTLLRCRTYGQFGFSLSDAAELISECDEESVRSRLKEKERYLQREIERNKRSLARLRDLNSLILQAEHQVGQCVIEQHPGIYRINYHRNGVLIEEPRDLKRFSEWSNMLPLSFVSLAVSLKALSTLTQDYYVGLGILEEDAEFLGVREEPGITYIPSSLAIRCVIAIPGEEPMDVSQLTPMLECAKERGFSVDPNGFIYSRMVLTVKRYKTGFVRYYQFFLPVTI